MKIRRLELKNVGVFDEEIIEFKECPVKDIAEIHILTGQNGSGKTTVLQALASAFCPIDYKNPLLRKFRTSGNGSEMDGSLLKVYLDSGQRSKLMGANGDFRQRNDIGYMRNAKVQPNASSSEILRYLVFAFSGYRHIENQSVVANSYPKDFDVLAQSLDFVKDYRSDGEITINQLLANNMSNRALAKEDGSFEEAQRYDAVISSIESFIFDVTGDKVKFVLKRSPNEIKLRIHEHELDFDVLPDGLRSLISWIADLLGRVDLLHWFDDFPIFEKKLILFLDEIEVHLHPEWQRMVLPAVQKLFKNSQIFISTHSPFVVNSVDNAWVYKFELSNGRATVAEPILSENSSSITQVLREIFGVDEWFGLEVQNNLERFKQLRLRIMSNGADETVENEMLEKARLLAAEPNDQLRQIVRRDLAELSEIKKKPYDL